MDIENEIRRLNRLVTRMDARSKAHETVMDALIAHAPDRAELQSAWETAARTIATSVDGPLAMNAPYQEALHAELIRMRLLLRLPE